jgi:hypothetical protein
VLLLRGSDYKSMDRKNLIHQVEENGEEEIVVEGVPVCSVNLVSPVTIITYFIEQVHYKIGIRLYIENAD